VREELKPFTDADNLAHLGMPFAFANYWEGAGKAVDGLSKSQWISKGAQDEEGSSVVIPGWWAVRFDTPQTVHEVRLLWADSMIGKDFDVQSWDGKAWKLIKAVRGNADKLSALKFDAPVSTRSVRIYITAAAAKDIGIAEIYMH
jgi:hypothetical protein